MRIGLVVGKMRFCAVGLVAVAFAASCGSSGSKGSALTFNQSDSLHLAGYMLGRDMGKSLASLRDMGAAFNEEAFILALRDVLAGDSSRVPDSLLVAADAQVKRALDAKNRERRSKFEEEALAASNKFLKENEKAPGVVVTASGLQYIVLKEGKGPKPTISDKVKVNYHGTLSDGTVFDSTNDREPVTFVVGGVIKGWMEALQMMSVGSKYKVVVPPDLAYGKDAPRGSRIGPNAVLIFEIELLGIEK